MKKVLLYFLIFLTTYNIYAESSYTVYKKILDKLPDCRDSATGAIDSDGNYTKGSDNGFNCSGFAKWIIDGFYTPLCSDNEPKYISLIQLRKKHLDKRGTQDILIYEDSRDPYFGLDWTRNLAVELAKKRGENPEYKSFDVIESKVYKYVNNCGYPLLKIEEIIKEKANEKTNYIYLGSINGFFGDNPKLWQHYHIAVFIPYYENDVFKIAVLERNKETSFKYLLSRYPNTWCHLVEISTEGLYELKAP